MTHQILAGGEILPAAGSEALCGRSRAGLVLDLPPERMVVKSTR
jgi:hypothetical protein